jgi:hypothetical protein
MSAGFFLGERERARGERAVRAERRETFGALLVGMIAVYGFLGFIFLNELSLRDFFGDF